MKPCLIAAVALAAGLALAGCGGGPARARDITVHGTANCTDPSVSFPGAPVVVTDPSGKVISTGTLTYDAATLNFRFTVTVPSEPRYGIEVSNLPPAWVTQAQMRKGPSLECTSG